MELGTEPITQTTFIFEEQEFWQLELNATGDLEILCKRDIDFLFTEVKRMITV